jgi:hypothetical protein
MVKHSGEEINHLDASLVKLHELLDEPRKLLVLHNFLSVFSLGWVVIASRVL